MPELPEVETTRLGISSHIVGQEIADIVIRRRDLRWPVSDDLPDFTGAKIQQIDRRSKYLLFHTDRPRSFLAHLGMSGSLRIVKPSDDWRKHDHIGIIFNNGKELRFHDPRRFGAFLTLNQSDTGTHPLLKKLGPEPLEETFDSTYLHEALKGKSTAIKTAVMNAEIVVGVGNIYASESLFRSGIHPRLAASKLSKPRTKKLTVAIKQVLNESIQEGGTTLRDFVNSDGEPGYFKQRLFVYGRKGEPCRTCATPISHCVLGQRATYWCKTCQKR
ncbi:MAG: bifunctional DNA-formamidopyrimidine glycosylase/DNA-(apurinic or apyrimidinic site) lyase [Akkermansiaceae bacterium]